MLLEQIIEQAQHYFMRIRAEQVLDTIAKQVRIYNFLALYRDKCEVISVRL